MDGEGDVVFSCCDGRRTELISLLMASEERKISENRYVQGEIGGGGFGERETGWANALPAATSGWLQYRQRPEQHVSSNLGGRKFGKGGRLLK